MEAKNKLLKCAVTARPFLTLIAAPFVAIGLLLILPPPAHAQPPLNILTQTDLSTPCNPATADVSRDYDFGCRRSPCRRECGADLHYTKWLSTGSDDPGSNVYQADTQECNIGSPPAISDPFSANIPAAEEILQ
jgi:hypothetical protein